MADKRRKRRIGVIIIIICDRINASTNFVGTPQDNDIVDGLSQVVPLDETVSANNAIYTAAEALCDAVDPAKNEDVSTDEIQSLLETLLSML